MSEKRKIKTNSYFPPFLKGFNKKKNLTASKDINFAVLSTPVLNLLQKVSEKEETASETVLRVIENYLLLINLNKVYNLLFYDALQYKTHTRLEKMKEMYMRRLSGYNLDFMKELDILIGDEIPSNKKQDILIDDELPIGKERALFRKQLEQKKPELPIVSNEIILPALNQVSYQSILRKLVEDGIFTGKIVENLNSNSEHGLLAITIYKATMSIVEMEIRKLIKEELFKAPPKNIEELYDRLAKLGESS